jgi:hypothetical protein
MPPGRQLDEYRRGGGGGTGAVGGTGGTEPPPAPRPVRTLAGEHDPVTHDVVDLGKRLEIATLDLSCSPAAILDQIKALAAQVRRLSG